MPFAVNDTVRLHWQEQGSGSPVFLIMGHAYPSEMWYPVIPALSAHHRVIWFDNRGTGLSDATRDATMADLVADARAVMDAAGLASAHVHGVSMGGGIALQLAHASPERVRSLILGCTALKSERLVQKPPGTVLKYYIPLRLLRGVLRKSMYGPACPDANAERDLDRLVRARFSPHGVLAQVKAMQTYAMTADKVAELRIPALVLHGTADTTVPFHHAEELIAALPDGRLISYDGVGHSYVVAVPDEANRDVLEFLQQVERRSGQVAQLP